MTSSASESLTTVALHVHHGGKLGVYEHQAASTQCTMRFSVFTPPGEGPFPTVFWLSGLTCTEDNFTTKAGAYKRAAELGVIVVAPDTSPRGAGVADDPEEAYDFGLGAGFYVDATQSPWAAHYQMQSYITQDLCTLVLASFPCDPNRLGIMGHSMGGHGALSLGLKNPDLYKSISAFAPIVAPSQVPWGQKALAGYLGDDRSTWNAYDSCALIAASGDRSSFPTILIDQGSSDNFLSEQLKPELFEAACKGVGQKLELRLQDGYDHSYFFISSFIDDHLDHHAS
ncbi:MAG: S-formylglutathione hydrolase, partial [Parvibaculaceae bacterium]|nr:S-formylglutathione hydrolase [Parvibaculaceae bacterium]